MIPMQTGLPKRPTKPSSCWVSSGCRCPSSPAELPPAHAEVVVEENDQVEVAVRPHTLHIVDADLKASKVVLARACRCRLGQVTVIVEGVDHWKLRHTGPTAEDLVARQDDGGVPTRRMLDICVDGDDQGGDAADCAVVDCPAGAGVLA